MAKDKEEPTSNDEKSDIWKDSRFQHLVADPRFRELPKSQRKVKIDKRFQSMFTDKKFNVKYTVDKYGRRVHSSAADDLRKYYELDSSATDDEDLENETEEQRKEEKALCRQSDESIPESDDDGNDALETDGEDQPLTLRERLLNPDIDYARGQGQPVTDSSDDESSEEDEDEPELLLEHVWGELDNDAETTEESTRRLAVCNMDWDRIRAVDLMVLLNSFLPPGGSVLSVKIYPSEYGKERMAEEEKHGPPELRREEAGDGKTSSKSKKSSSDSDDSEEELVQEQDSDAEEGEDYHMEKLRQYQLNRLRYYYAVVECDSIKTADKIYEECDSLEYESSATRIDLRFIPDETTFDEADVTDVCTELPDSNTYKPRQFTTTALQQAKVDLTWDETAVERREIGDKLLAGNLEEVDDADLRKLVAFSSEESDSSHVDDDHDYCGEDDGSDQGVTIAQNNWEETKCNETQNCDDAVSSIEQESQKENIKPKNNEKLGKKKANIEKRIDTNAETEPKDQEAEKSSKPRNKKKSEEDAIARYKALLADIKEQEEKEKEERNKCQLEVTWEFGAGDDSNNGNDSSDDNGGANAKSKLALTPIEKVLLKRSEKNKKRKEMRKKKRKEALGLGDADQIDSDDSIPDGIDMNDPYFAEEFQNGDFLKPKSKKGKDGKKQKGQKLLGGVDDEEKKRKEQELQLLLEDDDLADSGKKHFSLEKILEAENETKSKRKRKKLLKKSKSAIAAEQKEIEDDFQIDLNDKRFSAIYTSHHFNIDPTHSHFKKTRGMEKIIQEKLKRRHGVDDTNGDENRVGGNADKNAYKSEMPSKDDQENNTDSIEVKRPKKELENKLLVKSLKRKLINKN